MRKFRYSNLSLFSFLSRRDFCERSGPKDFFTTVLLPARRSLQLDEYPNKDRRTIVCRVIGEPCLVTSVGDPVRAFKLKSTVPVKITLTDCDGQPLKTGVHTIQVVKFSSATTSDPPIDATPTDAATTGNEFRLTDAATGEWHFNLATTSFSKGV